MSAPARFAAWLSEHQHVDEKLGIAYHYHPRSDSHSRVLAGYIWEDLLETCPAIRRDYDSKRIRAETNFEHTWSGTRKAKAIDLAIGRVDGAKIVDVLISCELKACMTEHGKSQPRIFDELSSSHQIVHAASPVAIAAGLAVVNIANTFISPLRQRRGEPLYVTQHDQPRVTDRMVRHLQSLAQRTGVNEAGFDAYCTFVVDCNNDPAQPARFWTDSPAPQEGDADHYGTFLTRICLAYVERFSDQ